METLIIKVENKKDFKIIVDFLKKLGVPFQKETAEKESTYNPEFVKQALQARQEIREGKYHEKTIETLWD